MKKYISFLLCIVLVFCNICIVASEKMSEKKLLKKMGVNKSGRFAAYDKLGAPVILEWEETNVQEPSHAKLMKEICDVACRAYADVEVRFLKNFPEVVEQEAQYAQFKPLFANGLDQVNWQEVEKQMHEQIKQIHNMDYSQLSGDDVYFFVKVRDKETNILLGFTIFLIKPDYPYGDVKDISIAIEPDQTGRGLGKLLICSIFKLVPEVERIFLFTRVTNNYAIAAYQAWGFTEDKDPIQDPWYTFKKEHWESLEYKVESSDVLQNAAESLVNLEE